ncbi:hypothetical protein Acr_17g0010420 [Actinidia rufa]|uniref:SWIM-type domain-containing protein n=1 Tax=Actinidia rufa TaxID=165716 RepID=A0A7J0G3W5_9ERIC|nr:hypothetical protein Acr_17g0010420 [Actinidia rufa]
MTTGHCKNVLNIPSRHPDHQYVEIYDLKEEGSTMNTSGSHATVSWPDVHTYGELLSGRGDLSVLGSFTQMFALGQSSRSTLAEEAPGQRICSLFSQGECIEAGGASGSVDPVERLVALGETGTQDNEDADVFPSDNLDEDIDVLLTNEANDDFDDDRHEDPNICEALHDNPHIPFFMNLVGADDVVAGRDLYDSCPTWSDVTPEFAKGMIFKDKDAVIRACNWYHVKKNKHFHVVETNKNVWSTRCSHDCPWKLRACLKKQHGFFEIKQYPGPHTCLHGMESLDHRNINSTFIAHLIKTQVAVHENVGVEKPWDSCDFRNIGLGHLIVLGMEGVTLISDWHAAIISAVKHEWETTRLRQPVGIHRYCLRHFRRTNSESAAREYRALCNEDPRKWILAHDGGYRWGVTTTNDSECYNNVLRGARDLPITSCVEVTFYRLVVTFNDKRRQIESALAKGLRASGSAEVVTSAAGMTGNHKHAVYLNPPSCDCGKWMIYHYPCSHMLDVCVKSGRQPWHLIDPKYSMDVYAHVYDTSFEPMDTDALTCRRCSSRLYDGELDPLVLQYVLRAGFKEFQDICMQTFGVIPPAEEIDSGRLGMSWLRRTFDVLPEHADDGVHFPNGPWGARWRPRLRTTTISTHVVRVYRDQLDRLRPDEFTWRSYDAIMHELPYYCRVASDIWVSKSPLVCFEVVEWHLPDRVCRQFQLTCVAGHFMHYVSTSGSDSSESQNLPYHTTRSPSHFPCHATNISSPSTSQHVLLLAVHAVCRCYPDIRILRYTYDAIIYVSHLVT